METALQHEDGEYASYMDRIQERISKIDQPLFKTTGSDLFEEYLNGFADPTERQYHNCNCCKHFLHRYGGLVIVTSTGRLQSAVFDAAEAPEKYRTAVQRVINAAEGGRISEVFISDLKVLGTPQAGGWSHLAMKNPTPWVGRAKAAHEAAAEKQQDFQQIVRALTEFPLDLLNQVVELLDVDGDALYRSEKVLGPARFLRDVQAATQDMKGQQRRNVIFALVAAAPAGFCHPRTSMIGTLLEDLQGGLSFDLAAIKFRKKMHPMLYQRPQAPPRAGQIEHAEKLVEKMGIAESLKRRFARVEDIGEFIWQVPELRTKAPKSGGVFDHLRKDAQASPLVRSLKATPITWLKFERDILPAAAKLEVDVPVRGNFYGLLTEAVLDSPPILQWDGFDPDRRNPLSWYVYQGGSYAHQWGLVGGWTEVPVLLQVPALWYGNTATHFANQIFFVLPFAKDSRMSGSGLFPEILKSDLHAVRSTIEAHSRTAEVGGRDEGNVNGLSFSGRDSLVNVRVTLSSGVISAYQLDRWE